jgi:hypothetical protein
MTDNITLPRAVAKVALDHIQWFIDNEEGGRFVEEREAITALHAALAEPEHIHTCGPDCQKPLCVNRRREIAAAVEAEREACAALMERQHTWISSVAASAAIRARGSK